MHSLTRTSCSVSYHDFMLKISSNSSKPLPSYRQLHVGRFKNAKILCTLPEIHQVDHEFNESHSSTCIRFLFAFKKGVSPVW